LESFLKIGGAYLPEKFKVDFMGGGGGKKKKKNFFFPPPRSEGITSG